MFSSNRKPSKPPETYEDEEDDDSIEEAVVSVVETSKPKPAAAAAKTTGGTGNYFTKTLDYYFSKGSPQQQQREAPIPAQTQGRDHSHQKPPPPLITRKLPSSVKSPLFSRSVQKPGLEKKQHGSKGKYYDDISDDEEEQVIVVRTPDVPKPKPRPKPSSVISRRSDSDSPAPLGSRSLPSATKPFSKRDLLRQFEETDSDDDDESSDNRGYGRRHAKKDSGDEESEQTDESLSSRSPDKQEDYDEEDDVVTPRRVRGFHHSLQNSRFRTLEIPNSEGDTEDSDDEDESDIGNQILKTPTKTLYGLASDLPNVDITPRRSMANPNLLEEDPDELERQEEAAKEEIIREILLRNAEVAAKQNFDIVVTMPTYEEVADSLFNPDEWEAVGVESRWTAEDGHVTYSIVYRDGHTRVVEAENILDHVDIETLEEFENDLFEREENAETYYYPNLKPPGGAFAGGTGVTSGVVKKRGRRSATKIVLDNMFRLGMPEEFNIPVTDSSASDSESEYLEELQGPILASQYDKFDITDAEILASIKENASDDEDWDGGRKGGRGRPRGRPSTSTRAHTMVRPTRAAAKRGRGRPPLTPTRGGSTIGQDRGEGRVKTNVVKASATSRGRGRPRGSKSVSRTDTSESSRSDTPASFTAPVKTSATRGRPKGSKNMSKSVPSYSSDSSSLSDLPTPARPITPARPPTTSENPTPQPIPKPKFKTPEKTRPKLKPTRVPKPGNTPSGARGPGRPPKREEELIEETIRTAGANITSAASSHHRRSLSSTGPLPPTDTGPPKKRRRIRFGADGPESASENDSPKRKAPPFILPSQRPSFILPSQRTPKKSHPKPPNQQHKQQRVQESHDKDTFKYDVDKIINKMFLDGSPAYHVQCNTPGSNKTTMWVRLENLQGKAAKKKVKEFEEGLKEREIQAKLTRDRINAQLQKDRQRVAEREAQILGTGKSIERNEEEERKEKEKEEQRQKDRIARRLAMQETLFAGT